MPAPKPSTYIWRKLTTKPVWWLETKRPYPIRGHWKYLPPIRADQGPVIFVVMARPRTFDDALWCAWSWMRFIAPEARLEIHVDGPVGARERQAVETLFPGGAISDARAVISEAESLLPKAQGFFSLHPMGRKLGVMLRSQKKEKVFYCDCDVLAFAAPIEILNSLKDPKAGAYLQESGEGLYDDLVLESAQALGITPCKSLNTGLLVIPKESLSFDLAKVMLHGWKDCRLTWFIEQTVLACLLKSAPMIALPRERYLVSNHRQFYWQKDIDDYGLIAARHFTTPTRHVMYMKGMPWLERESRKPANPRVAGLL